MHKSKSWETIQVWGARSHNLKNIDCEIPRNTLTVVTGVSGSGKSTLAFNTLFAEGQRRYVESLSAYARQFLQKLPRPLVDKVENIPPAIAIEQRNRVKNSRSTVGTVTEIHDYLRLLLAKIGTITCPDCHIPVARSTPAGISEQLLHDFPGEAVSVLFPAGAVIDRESLRERWMRDGFIRLLAESDQKLTTLRIDEATDESTNWIGVVVDRLHLKETDRKRLLESLELAFIRGGGEALIFFSEKAGKETLRRFFTQLRCNSCGKTFPELRPVQFSFNNPLGACPRCEGFGRIMGVDYERVIPDPRKTLREGAIDPFTKPAYKECQTDLRKACDQLKIPMHKPFEDLSAEHKKIVLEGKGKWYGVKGFFKWLEGKRYKAHVRIFISRYRGFTICPDCGGNRLRPESLNVRLHGKNITEICALPVADLQAWLSSLKFKGEEIEITKTVFRELNNRLRYLNEVGLGYLTLGRQARTLSGGEAQRIALASALGSALTDTLYVLDEPSIGLHPRDSSRLMKILFQLRNLGNTLVLVEHDPEIIGKGDWILDMGPFAGHQGGEVVFQGKLPDLLNQKNTLTGKYLRQRLNSHPVKRRRWSSSIKIHGANMHNLNDLNLEIPMGVLVAITGVSGAGKSTLAHHVLYAAYQKSRGQAPVFEPAEVRKIEGFEKIHEMILMNQDPVGRSLRSNVATYMDIYKEVRDLFAQTKSARKFGLSAGAFSFNVAGGRCEACQGAGEITIEMQFLEDVVVTCETCNGNRFSPKVLGVRLRDKSIVDVLNMTVLEAQTFFADRPHLLEKMRILSAVGLDYLKLGQSTSTLSGGEAQRLKLASFMAQGDPSHHVFIFDEPTTGLHLYDIEKLVQTFQGMVEHGQSVLVIEHNPDLILACDWVIDLGPEGGPGGGQVVTQGTPEQVMEVPESYTGLYLKKVLGRF